MTTFYLPIEISKRELTGKMFLATKLASMGHEAVVFFYKIFDQTRWPGAGVYIGKNCFRTLVPQSPKHYLKMKQAGIDLWYLDEEAGIYAGEGIEDWRSRFVERLDVTHLQAPDKVLAWGRWQKQLLLEQRAQLDVRVTGSPNFDLLQPQYNDVLEPFDLAQTGGLNDFILVNTRFTTSNGVFSLQDYLNMCNAGEEKQQLIWAAADGAMQYLFVQMVQKLASAHANETFVLRPHPAEDDAFYQLMFSEYDNVHVDKTGDVGCWIRRCKAVVQNGCTTGIQAKINGKPVFTYMPLQEDDASAAGLANKVGVVVRSSDELMQQLGRPQSDERAIWQETISQLNTIEMLGDMVDENTDGWRESKLNVPASRICQTAKAYDVLEHMKDVALLPFAQKRRYSRLYRDKFDMAFFNAGEGAHAAANRYYNTQTNIKRASKYCYLISPCS